MARPAAGALFALATLVWALAPSELEAQDSIFSETFETAGVCAWGQVVPLPTWYLDADHDGFGDPTITVASCSAPPGYVPDGKDCSDSDAGVDDCAGSFCNGAGACVQCLSDSDCGTSSDCGTYSCSEGMCLSSFSPFGTPASNQTSGDCQLLACDGTGGTTSLPDNADLPDDDGFQCTAEICLAGIPSHPALSSGSPCSEGGGSLCDGAGTCVQCLSAPDCGTDSECLSYGCTAGVCLSSFSPQGSPLSNQISGDCQLLACDGAGGTTSIPDNEDLPEDDGFQCTGEACFGGTPAHPPLSIDTPCSDGGGAFCDGAGTCVECNEGNQCPSGQCVGNVCLPDGASLGSNPASELLGRLLLAELLQPSGVCARK